MRTPKGTAMSRKTLSQPAKWLKKKGLLNGTILDFGCGRGTDAKFLAKDGIEVATYDKFWGPCMPQGYFDTVMSNFVFNVITDDTDFFEALELLKAKVAQGGTAYITVRREKEIHDIPSQRWVEFDPEFVSIRKTSSLETYKWTNI